MSAAVEALNNVASNNAQIRAQGEQWGIQADEQRKENVDTALDFALKQSEAIGESIVDGIVADNAQRFADALTDEIMTGNFEFKDGNAENGLCETWNDYWANYTNFRDKWMDGVDADNNKNVSGGILTKYKTKTAIDNYLSNSKSDIANSRKTQLWEQKVQNQKDAINNIMGSTFDEGKYTSTREGYLATLGLKEEDLANVTDYHIAEFYAYYLAQKALYDSPNSEKNDYYWASTQLNVALSAKVSNMGNETFDNFFYGTEGQEAQINNKIINAASVAYLDDDLNKAFNESGGSSDGLETFLKANEITPLLEGQDGKYIRPEGLSSEEVELANSTMKSKVTEKWYSKSATATKMFDDLYTDMSLATDIVFSSMQDVLDFKNANEKYSSLNDDYVKTLLKKDNTFITNMAKNAKLKSIGEAIEVLGNAQTVLPTLTGDEKTAYETKAEAAYLTLYTNGYWSYVSDYFEFGDSWVVTDDTGSWKNKRTEGVFDYISKKKAEGVTMDFATAVIKSGFLDSMSNGATNGSTKITGSFAESFTYDTGRYMENHWEKFFDVAYNAESILEGQYSSEEIEEKFPSESDKIKEAARLKGFDIESNEQGFSALTESYETAEKYLSVGGSVVEDKDALKKIFGYQTIYNNPNSSDKEKNSAGTKAIALQKSTYLALFPEEIGWGYMIYESQIGNSSYKQEPVKFAYTKKVVSSIDAIKKTGSREKMMNLLDYYGVTAKAEADPDSKYAEAISALNDARDWRSVVDDGFIAMVVDVAPESALNFYSVFADGVDINTTDYISASGSAGSLEDQIKANTSSTYTAARSAYLRYCYITKDDAVYGQDYNGVSVEGTDIVGSGGVYSEAFRYYCGLKSTATDEVSVLGLEREAKGYLTPEALNKLKNTESSNLALWSIGYDSFNGVTVQDLISLKYADSKYGKAQKDSSYTDMMSFLATKTTWTKDCNEARERIKNGEAPNLVASDLKEKLYGYCDDYITYSNEATIATVERQRNGDAGADYSFVGFMTTYSGESDLTIREDNAYTNLDESRKASSKLEGTYFAGDLSTRGHMANIFSPQGTKTVNEAQAQNYNLAVNIQAGNVGSTDKNAVELLSWAMAYNEVAEQTGMGSFVLNAEDLTSENIKNKTGLLWDYMSETLTPLQQYEVERLKNSLSYTVKVVAQFQEYGFDDTLSYYCSEDGSTFFISDKAKKITINSDGSISYQLPDSIGGGTITDISLYSDDTNRNSVLHEAFQGAEDGILEDGYLQKNPVVNEFVSSNGVQNVKQYNVTKEYLDGENPEGEEVVLMAYPTYIEFTQLNGIVNRSGEAVNESAIPSSYNCYPMTLSQTKELYEYYVSNSMADKADELCSMLTETQQKFIKTETSSTQLKLNTATKSDKEQRSYSELESSQREWVTKGMNTGNEAVFKSRLMAEAENENELDDLVNIYTSLHNEGSFVPGRTEDFGQWINGIADSVREEKGWSENGKAEGGDFVKYYNNISGERDFTLGDVSNYLLDGLNLTSSPKKVTETINSRAKEIKKEIDANYSEDTAAELNDMLDKITSLSNWAGKHKIATDSDISSLIESSDDKNVTVEWLRQFDYAGVITVDHAGMSLDEYWREWL